VQLLEPPDHVRDRAGDEEVLLLEAQRLPLVALIVRVEHLGDVLGVDLLLDGAAVVALVEELQVEIAGGARATVEGAQMVGGRITLKYESDGPSVDAAVPGDYIYPSDVRISSKRDRLYVKASGFAAGIRKETWLYEYDLQNRKQMRKKLVDPAVLPDECRMPQK
jgi:hypothetical protein